jgi:hypothetical protein
MNGHIFCPLSSCLNIKSYQQIKELLVFNKFLHSFYYLITEEGNGRLPYLMAIYHVSHPYRRPEFMFVFTFLDSGWEDEIL